MQSSKVSPLPAIIKNHHGCLFLVCMNCRGGPRQFLGAKPSESHAVCQALSEDKKKRTRLGGRKRMKVHVFLSMCVCLLHKNESPKDERESIVAEVSMAMMLVS